MIPCLNGGHAPCSQKPRRAPKEEIVISGMSGRFPESDHMDEFRDNLYARVDMVTEDDRRWPIGLWDLPKRSAKIKNLSAFDASFFGIDDKEADLMDPQVRFLLELTFEAICDSGLKPEDLKGARTGVFLGCFFSEIDGALTPHDTEALGYRQLFARYINYSFDFRGPSYSYDTACSSSFAALNEALTCLRSGQLDFALVVGCNIPLWPGRTLQFSKFNMLSEDGKCNFLDAGGSGYVKAEACAAALLQKKATAKRIYAHLVHSKSNTDGFKEEGITFPKWRAQFDLLEETYSEAQVDPMDINFIEAHGTGTQAGDTQETRAIWEMFCKNRGRTEPLLLGSVKTNMGHSEASSGLCSLAKVIIAFENECLPPNLHLKTPNPKIQPLIDGAVAPVLQNTPFTGQYVGINSFGFGGSNNHVILKRNEKEFDQDSLRVVEDLPRLTLTCGRTEASVTHILQEVQRMYGQKKLSREFLSLLDDFAKFTPSSGMSHRGFLMITEHDVQVSEVEKSFPERRPLWFVFPGLGSQWKAMARSLMPIKQFAESLLESARIVNSLLEVDLIDLLVNESCPIDVEVSPVAGVALAAFQMALLALFRELGLEPDGYVGHSVGELGCAFADGCLSKHQMLLAPYFLNKCIEESDLRPGLMAAIGLSWEEATRKCPPGVFPACHNGLDSVTISGPLSEVKAFMHQLQEEGTFVREVKSCGIAFHSPLMGRDVAPALHAAFEKLIPESKPRSQKWISSSVKEQEWDSKAKQPLADYLIDNLVNPVLFYEACQHIPDNAVAVEISPQSFLLPVLKRNLRETQVQMVPLLRRNNNDANLKTLLNGLGELYNLGYDVAIENIYPKVSYPLPRGTPSLSSLIKWDHSKPRLVRLYPDFFNSDPFFENIVTIDINSEEHQYLTGHYIDGRILFPATGYLLLAWTMFAKLHKTTFDQMPVEFKDVTISRATILSDNNTTKFAISFMKGIDSFSFFVEEGGAVVAKGVISELQDLGLSPEYNHFYRTDEIKLSSSDIYKELRIRGYEYGSTFRNLTEASSNNREGKIKWTGQWVAFADNMLQLVALNQTTRGLLLPVGVQSIKCLPKKLLESAISSLIPVTFDEHVNICRSEGIEMTGFKFSSASKKGKHDNDAAEMYSFTAYENNDLVDQNQEVLIRPLVDIAIENTLETGLNVVEISCDSRPFVEAVYPILESNPSLTFDYSLIQDLASSELSSESNVNPEVQVLKCDIESSQSAFALQAANIVVYKSSRDLEKTRALLTFFYENMMDRSFLIMVFVEKNQIVDYVTRAEKAGFYKIGIRASREQTVVLLRKVDKVCDPLKQTIIGVNARDFSWVEELKKSLQLNRASGENIWLIANDTSLNGVVGLVNCLRREPGGDKIRCLFDYSGNLSLKDLNGNDTMLSKMVRKDLVMNVFDNEQWGSFRHFNISRELEQMKDTVHAYVNIKTLGDLTSFRWFEGRQKFWPEGKQSWETLVHVNYASLNFRDIMFATGKLPIDALPKEMENKSCPLGLEFSGYAESGLRVMGIVSARGLASTVISEDPDFLWEVPNEWSLEEAATIPIVYCTVYYALIIRGKLEPGESVLIHSGSGGVGQAAISVCLSMGCTVYTTVGSVEKRNLLKSIFPQLTDGQFANSRDTSFEDHIMKQTNGRGVDAVLNSLAEEKLQASLRCLAENGRFLEIGKFDMTQDNQMDLSSMTRNKSFHSILLDALFGMGRGPEQLPPTVKYHRKLLKQMIGEGIANGAVVPLPMTVFASDHIEEAFRFMANGKHVGKVVIKLKEEEKEPKSFLHYTSLKTRAIARTWFHPLKVYVVVGGLGGFGLELAFWLIERGARKLVLTSRSGPKSSHQLWSLQRLRKHKQVDVIVSQVNASSATGASQLLTECRALGSIGAIFNLSMVLKDGLMENQSEAKFRDVCEPKASATIYLDKMSRDLCPDLDYFVVFSSVSCGKGNGGQTNYGFANSIMERVCEERRRQGLHGLAIQWGAIGDVGVLANAGDDKELVIRGTRPQRIASCLYFLDKFIQTEHAVVSSFSPFSGNRVKKTSQPTGSLVEKVAHIIGIKDQKSLSPTCNQTLGELGIDSLMAIEIKQTLERHLENTFNVQELRQLTISDLHRLGRSPQS